MKRVATVEELKALPAGRTILLSKKRNKKFKHRYLLDLRKGPYYETLIVDGYFQTESDYANYLPAKIIWQGDY